MRFPKISFASFAILFLLASLPAFGQSGASWTVVRLSDKVNGRLSCRSQPNANASVVRTFRHGALVKTIDEESPFMKVISVPGEAEGSSNCWVNRKYIYGLPSKIRGRIYTGNYRYSGRQMLRCRRAVGYNTPASKVVYYMRARIEATGVGIDTNGQSWLFTGDNCFIPALSDNLIWNDSGEDPHTMCSYLEGSC